MRITGTGHMDQFVRHSEDMNASVPSGFPSSPSVKLKPKHIHCADGSRSFSYNAESPGLRGTNRSFGLDLSLFYPPEDSKSLQPLNPNKGIVSLEEGSLQVLTVNKVACRILGYSALELSTLTLKDLYQGHKLQKTIAESIGIDSSGRGVLHSGTVVEFTHKEGHLIPVSLWLRLFSYGNCQRLIAVFEPVEKFVARIHFDGEGIIQDVDEVGAALLGVPLDKNELIGKKLVDFFPTIASPSLPSQPPASPSKEVSCMKQMLTSRTIDGINTPVSMKILPEEDELGELIPGRFCAFVWTYLNVSGLVVWDATKDTIEDINPSVCSLLFGYKTQELLGRVDGAEVLNGNFSRGDFQMISTPAAKSARPKETSSCLHIPPGRYSTQAKHKTGHSVLDMVSFQFLDGTATPDALIPENEFASGEYGKKYTNLHEIGQGGFGFVKAAFRNCDRRLVITKFIEKKKVFRESWIKSDHFGNRDVPLEIHILSQLHHPNIVEVLDVFETELLFPLVMEKHGSGMDLFEFIERHPKLTEPLVSYIFRQIVEALKYLHGQGIVHRDIKDENIILNEKFHAKLIDFGSAAPISPGKFYSKMCGTTEYCSPEILLGEKYAGPEAEVWALGVTLYTLVYGENPFFSIEDIIEEDLEFPWDPSKELSQLLQGLLEKYPTRRMSLEAVAQHPWVQLPFDPTSVTFEEVISCDADELVPPKYYPKEIQQPRTPGFGMDSFQPYRSHGVNGATPEANLCGAMLVPPSRNPPLEVVVALGVANPPNENPALRGARPTVAGVVVTLLCPKESPVGALDVPMGPPNEVGVVPVLNVTLAVLAREGNPIPVVEAPEPERTMAPGPTIQNSHLPDKRPHPEKPRFVSYNATSLERSYKWEVLTEPDLGVSIDLINLEAYEPQPDAQLDPADERLLEEDAHAQQDSKRSRHHAKSVSWLRRTEYISTELTRFQPQTIDKVEAKVGYNIKKMYKEENLYMDKESQMKAIDKTFDDAKKPIKEHYSKPGVVPVEILPVLPDFQLWKYPWAQVIFDSDPAPSGHPSMLQQEEMSQAMIRGVMDESGEQFVAYFLPTEDTLEKRRKDFQEGVEYKDDEEYEYRMAREYNWNVKNKASGGYEENHFFISRPDGMYYNTLETRVRLTKRRLKPGAKPNNTRLIVTHRPLNRQEHNNLRMREKQLETGGEDEDEEEDQEDKDNEKENKSSSSDEEEEGEKKRKASASEESEDEGSGKSGSSEEEDDEGKEKAKQKKAEHSAKDGEGSDKAQGMRGEKEQTVESVIANSSLPLEKRLTFAENVFFAPRMEIHWKENSVLECLSSLLLQPAEPSQLSAIEEVMLSIKDIQKKIQDFLIKYLFHRDLHMSYHLLFLVMQGKEPRSQLQPHIQLLLKILVEALGNLEASKVSHIFQVLLMGYFGQVKEETHTLPKEAMLLFLFHLLRLYPKVEGGTAFECGKLPKAPPKLEAPQCLSILAGVFEMLQQLKVDPLKDVCGGTLQTWISALLEILLKEPFHPVPAWFQVMSEVGLLDIRFLESKISRILALGMTSNQSTAQSKSALAHMLCTCLSQYHSIRQVPKLIAKLLNGLRDEIIQEGQAIKIAEIPEEFLLQFGECISRLAPGQSIELWKTLLHFTSAKAFQDANLLWVQEKHFLVMSMKLFETYMRHVRLLDCSLPLAVANRVPEHMHRTQCDTLLHLAQKILQQEHDWEIMGGFLNLSHSWGELHTLLQTYDKGETGPKIMKVPDNGATDLSSVHSHIDATTWAQIASRVLNFGDTDCHKFLYKLVVQKLKANELLQEVPDLDARASCLKFLTEHCDNHGEEMKQYVPYLAVMMNDFQLLALGNEVVAARLRAQSDWGRDILASFCEIPMLQNALVFELCAQLGRSIARVKGKHKVSGLCAMPALGVLSLLTEEHGVKWVSQGQTKNPELLVQAWGKFAEVIREREVTGELRVKDWTGIRGTLEAFLDLPLEYISPDNQSLVVLVLCLLLDHMKEVREEEDWVKPLCYQVMQGAIGHQQYIPLFQWADTSFFFLWFTWQHDQVDGRVLRAFGKLASGSKTSINCLEPFVDAFRNAATITQQHLDVAVSLIVPLFKQWTAKSVEKARSLLKKLVAAVEVWILVYLESLSEETLQLQTEETLWECAEACLAYRFHRSKKSPHKWKILGSLLMFACSSSHTRGTLGFLQLLNTHQDELKEALPSDYPQIQWQILQRLSLWDEAGKCLEYVFVHSKEDELHVLCKTMLELMREAVESGKEEKVRLALCPWKALLQAFMPEETFQFKCNAVEKLSVMLLLPELTLASRVHVLKFLSDCISRGSVKWDMGLILDCFPCKEQMEQHSMITINALTACGDVLKAVLGQPMRNSRVPLIVEKLRFVIHTTQRYALNGNLPIMEEAALTQCANDITRLLALLKNSAEDMKRVAPYLAASIIAGFVGGTFPSAIESSLMAGLMNVLDLCDEHGIGMLRVQLNHAPREVFLAALEQYRKYHKSAVSCNMVRTLRSQRNLQQDKENGFKQETATSGLQRTRRKKRPLQEKLQNQKKAESSRQESECSPSKNNLGENSYKRNESHSSSSEAISRLHPAQINLDIILQNVAHVKEKQEKKHKSYSHRSCNLGPLNPLKTPAARRLRHVKQSTPRIDKEELEEESCFGFTSDDSDISLPVSPVKKDSVVGELHLASPGTSSVASFKCKPFRAPNHIPFRFSVDDLIRQRQRALALSHIRGGFSSLQDEHSRFSCLDSQTSNSNQTEITKSATFLKECPLVDDSDHGKSKPLKEEGKKNRSRKPRKNKDEDLGSPKKKKNEGLRKPRKKKDDNLDKKSHPSTFKTRKKKVDPAEVERWASTMNAQFDEIDKMELCFPLLATTDLRRVRKEAQALATMALSIWVITFLSLETRMDRPPDHGGLCELGFALHNLAIQLFCVRG
ncbi:unnamed protein product [Darwinula stevensoni]|uniref:RNA polymerase II-associated factor 1 homolog n=1 Tax=Darwinula stevensoni TaxID=69355 RepID=A0A7R8ZZV9_9CRUS|nr:unnamed protein product [Darwinula stevensoni]CAG0883333.1 unnamed protein product [Darwinula stevensoni]